MNSETPTYTSTLDSDTMAPAIAQAVSAPKATVSPHTKG